LRLDWTAALEDFFRTAHERQRIWHVRDSGASAPWTDDPVFSSWKFTNVFRELDAGTVFLIDRITEARAAGLSDADIVWNVWFYRELNNVDSWRDVLGGFVSMADLEPRDVVARMAERKKSKKPVFTSAHMAPSFKAVTEAIPTVAWMSEALAVKLKAAPSLEGAYEWMTCVDGVGSFLGYQMVQDLTYGPDPVVTVGVDEWAHAGPGALGGLEVVFGYKLKPTEAMGAMRRLRDVQDEAYHRLELDFQSVAAPGLQRLHLSSIEHWLCEYFKYDRIRAGGYGKTRYVPGRGEQEPE